MPHDEGQTDLQHVPRGRRRWLLAIGAVAAAVALCAGVVVAVRDRGDDPVVDGPRPTATTAVPSSAGPSSSGPSTSLPDGGSRPGPPPGATKPPLQGLLDRQGEPAADQRGAVSGWVVNIRWADLQPADGAGLVTPNAIDAAVDRVRLLNQGAPPHPLRLKVRLSAGVDAPDWLKQAGGGPVTITDPTSPRTGTVGRFWTDEFGLAYARLHQLLAARYDAVAEIAEVTVSRCSTLFAEPFIRQDADPRNLQALLAAGDTADADRRCLTSQIDAHLAWTRTLSGLALNPYQALDAPGRAGNEPFTESVMERCRTVLGPRCVLESNSIRWPPQEGAMGQLYQAIRRLGPPISFQTATPERIGDPQKTLDFAADQGANAVELPRSYPSWPPALLQGAAERLGRNPTA